MKKLLYILLLLSFTKAVNAQSKNYISINRAEEIPWEQFHPTDKRFIVAGEAHQVASIFPFQLSHLKYLVTKGYRHLVWEVPYSFGYIGHQYITTGNESLLRYISYSIEDLAYWRGVYALNKSLAPGDKIHLWGIDHELGKDLRGQLRVKTFQKAISLMMEGKGELPPSLKHELDSLLKAETVDELNKVKRRIQDRQKVLNAYFGKDLPHFNILLNRVDFYKVKRNDEMLEAFKEICSLFKIDKSAKFLGRFGWGHTDKSYKQSMSWLLENDPSSPVNGSVYVIGVHYLNCMASVTRAGLPLPNVGIVSADWEKKTLFNIDQKHPSPIKIFQSALHEKKPGWTKNADVLFLFAGFPGVTVFNSTPVPKPK